MFLICKVKFDAVYSQQGKCTCGRHCPNSCRLQFYVIRNWGDRIVLHWTGCRALGPLPYLFIRILNLRRMFSVAYNFTQYASVRIQSQVLWQNLIKEHFQSILLASVLIKIQSPMYYIIVLVFIDSAPYSPCAKA